jgi:para-aminobenzoate synthetase component 1
MGRRDGPPVAVVGSRLCTELLDVTSDLEALDSSGFWAVVIPYEGAPTCAKFGRVRPAVAWSGPRWVGPSYDDWASSLTETEFGIAVERIREHIAAGEAYQVNLTRVMSAPLADHDGQRIEALGAALARDNPAPFSAVVSLPLHGVHVASASPERFLSRVDRAIASSPIKGTAASSTAFTPKDFAENVMIVDLVRNDLGRVCEWGSVSVPKLLEIEVHPGLYHLVSTVEGRLRPACGWADAIAATFPPGSVTGAPKIAACDIIGELEPVSRDVYCGAIGWVDADRQTGDLNVAIRTFWIAEDHLHFGTGGGITWDSTPAGEWEETMLKARKLIGIASGRP